MDLKVGDFVRIKTSQELANDDDWTFDPFTHWWKYKETATVRHTRLNSFTTVTAVHSDENVSFTDYWSAPLCIVAEVIHSGPRGCECGAEKHGFLGHSHWCPMSSHMNKDESY